MLVKRVFHVVPDVSVSGHHQYSLFLLEDEDARDFMKAIRVQEYSPIFGGVYWTKSLLQPGLFNGESF